MSLLIRMTRPHLRELPDSIIPEGYQLANATEVEDLPQVWMDVVNESFGDENWTLESIHRDFISRPQYDPEGVFFAMHEGQAVATAFAWLDEPGETASGRVHFVGTLAEHRGKGLARMVVTAILHYFAARGFQSSFLETHPHRLPAIRVYLRLGFEPTPRKEEEAEAWRQVMTELGEGV